MFDDYLVTKGIKNEIKILFGFVLRVFVSYLIT